MASAYSTPKPAETSALPAADAESQPAADSVIDIALVGGVMIVVSLIIVLTIFFMVYWDVLVTATQYPLRPSR